MKLTHTFQSLAATAVFATLSVFAGCTHDARDGPGTRPALSDASASEASKTGSRLWSENCNRCHYIRPSTQYSAQQWDLIVHHMRLRANLTGEEQRKITAFMQSGG